MLLSLTGSRFDHDAFPLRGRVGIIWPSALEEGAWSAWPTVTLGPLCFHVLGRLSARARKTSAISLISREEGYFPLTRQRCKGTRYQQVHL